HADAEPSLRTRPATRWIAAAAAAGLLIGLVAGHMTHDFSIMARPLRPVRTIATIDPTPETPALRAVATTISEEEFLSEIDVAIESTGSPSLRPLDDLTPRVWEVSAP